MNKKLQVFVSSTYTDLIEERQAAVQAILDAGHIPAGMELFKAGKSQMQTIRKWIDDSDVYMLILGGRYGSIEEESGLSYTELEYRYAISKNMPVFAVILDDSFLFTKASSIGKEKIFENENIDKYNTFKKFVETNIVKFAKNNDQIALSIHSQLNHFLNDNEYNFLGWSRDVKNFSEEINYYKENIKTIKVATLLYELGTIPLSDIKSTIEQSCEMISCSKNIVFNHIRDNEQVNMSDVKKICSSSDIIIFDISIYDELNMFLLGYFSTLINSNIILIGYGPNCVAASFAIENYCPTFPKIITYYDKISLSFKDALKQSIDKYIFK